MLKMKRIIHLFLAVLIVIGMITLFDYKTNEDYRQKKEEYLMNLKKYEKESVRSIALVTSEMIKPNKELTIAATKKLENVDVSNSEEVRSILNEKSEGFSSIGWFYFGRAKDGAQIQAKGGGTLPRGFDPRKRTWYLEATKKKNFVVTAPYIDAITKQACIALAKPVFKNNQLLGVVGLDIFFDKTKEILKNFGGGNYENYFIFDKNGNIIVYTKPKILGHKLEELIPEINDQKNITYTDDKEIEYDIRNFHGSALKGYGWNIKELNWKVVSIINPEMIDNELNSIWSDIFVRNLMIITVIAFAGLLLYGTYLIIRKRQIHEALIYDNLTELPNRYYLEEKFEEVKSELRIGKDVTFLFIDIDNFKIINDTLGHAAGDSVLKDISEFLKDNISPADILVRLGSDEFVIVMTGADMDIAKFKATKLQKAIYEYPLSVNNQAFDISLSIGVIKINENMDIQKLLSLADAALNSAKANGKNKVVCISPDQNIAGLDVMSKVNRTVTLIKNSLRDERLELFLQPIVSLETHKVKHYEALVRIKNSEGDLIAPSEFIPVAENFGLIHMIDKWMFDRVVEILKVREDISIFLNLSAVTLNYEETLDYFEKTIVRENKIRKLNIGFEITESSALKNYSTAITWINRLKAAGCSFSLDDFGVGYTSFSYLRELQTDFVKVDGSFVKNIDVNSDHRAIVEAISNMVKSLGKRTVAEYVESDAIAEILKEIGIDYGQGYHFSKPIPARDIV